MLCSLLLGASAMQGGPPSLDASRLGKAASIDHAPLFGGWGGLAMLSPERERWAVAVLEEVGPERKRAAVEGNLQEYGSWYVFDVTVRVLDAWNLPPGSLHAFWKQDGRRRRRATLASMVGSRVLVRLAPTEEGHYLWVGGNDGEPAVSPNYSIESGRDYVDRVLPTEAAKLASGPPNAKRWYSLWQAGSSLSATAYPEFAGHMSVVTMPQTPRYPKGRLSEEQVGEADVQWLQRLARKQNPEFQMMVADYLSRRDVVGAQQMMHELVLLSLRDPRAFPNGLFRVADPHFLRAHRDPDAPQWPPMETLVRAAAGSKNPRLVADLLNLVMDYPHLLPAGRSKLLPFLTHPDPGVNRAAYAAFDLWHGAPPKNTYGLAWHRERASMSKEELKAAKVAPGR